MNNTLMDKPIFYIRLNVRSPPLNVYSSLPNEHSAAANKEDIGLREVLYSTGRTFYSV